MILSGQAATDSRAAGSKDLALFLLKSTVVSAGQMSRVWIWGWKCISTY